MSTNELLHPARFSEAAGYGLRVFPVRPRDKKPAIPWKPFQTEGASPADIAAWDQSDFNVGVVTGAASGIVALDVDSPEAQELVDGMQLPKTPVVGTARGQHLYFKHPGFKVPNGTKIAGEKLDVRGDGGFVVGAGSIHSSGARYEWVISPAEVPFAPLPENVLALLRRGKEPGAALALGPQAPMPSTGIDGLDRLLADELASAQEEIGTATEGERNNTLFKAAARLARHVAGASLEWEPFGLALRASAISVGLGDAEIDATVENGWKAGSTEPTAWIRIARDHVYLSNQERFYHLPSGKDLKPTGFNGQFGSLYRGKGTLSNFLLNGDYVRKLYDLTYDPRDRREVIERDGYHWLNTFKPSEVSAVAGDASPFVDFLVGLAPDEGEREHLIKMMAYTVRNPGMKLRYALLLRTAVQGVGKSMLIDIWGRLLGQHNVRKTTSKELASDYQGYLPEKLLVVCEELNLGFGFKTYNDLKDMITANTAVVNEKHLRQRIWPIYATFAFLSNLETPIQVEDTDRRIFYIDSPAKRREAGYYKDFAAWWEANLGIIRHYLEGIDLTTFNPHEAPPVTASKIALIARSRSELTQELALAIEGRLGRFDRDLVTLDEVRFELGAVGRIKSVPQLTKALKEVGAISLGQQRAGSRRVSLWAVRNVDYWWLAEDAVCAEELSRNEGVFAFLEGTGMTVGHISELPVDARMLAEEGLEGYSKR